jgi:hypothetical protein
MSYRLNIFSPLKATNFLLTLIRKKLSQNLCIEVLSLFFFSFVFYLNRADLIRFEVLFASVLSKYIVICEVSQLFRKLDFSILFRLEWKLSKSLLKFEMKNNVGLWLYNAQENKLTFFFLLKDACFCRNVNDFV